MKKLISVLFALLLVASCMTVTMFATDAETSAPAADSSSASASSGSTSTAVSEDNVYLTTMYYNAEERLADKDMELMLEKHGYQLYIDTVTAEIAVVHVATGQVLFSNPYDIAASKGTASTKSQLLSQILIKYTENGVSKDYNSFADAVLNNQIIIEPIKNGIRVEYTIGRADSNFLVPRLISKDRLESQILNKLDKEDPYENWAYSKLSAFYRLEDPNDPTKVEAVKETMFKNYPVTKTGMAVYALTDIVTREFKELEGYIKEYCPDYTYDEMEYDHTMTQYVADTLSTPVFRLALEYTLTEDGLEVTLPANGIRFDETLYTLDSITLLPFMGAGTCTNQGYTFVPDGSGALMDFAAFPDKNTSIAGTVYGMDFAYQKLEGSANQDVMRMPVFGLRETFADNKYVIEKVSYMKDVKKVDEYGQPVLDENGDQIIEQEEAFKDVRTLVSSELVDRGFFAVIKEGDALSKITAKHDNQLHDYNTVQLSFNPRPKDSYSLEALSVGTSSEIQVVSDRKYVGNYTVKYYMLLDDDKAEAAGLSEDDYYETSWMGMAEAYRDYLFESEILTPLTKDEVDENIPLYIETFGATETIEKVLSVPTTVSRALTSFDDIKTMFDELAAAGITNIDFKLTGYANGGMYATIPYKLKWEKSVGGADGYSDLLKYAAEKGFGLYPDFDFVYVNRHKNFDGLKFDRDILKTIDNRYSSLREYDASLQEFVSYFTLCVSPSAYMTFYEKFAQNYLGYENKNISVSTIGSALNSDFDEDDPYNRNDSKNLTVEFLEKLDTDMTSVMSESGNVYTWKYIDKMLNVSLQSSRSLYASATVPFMGVVLHGSVEFTGAPINMAGDIKYEILRAIENGAGIYFILSYDNTELLKEDYDLSKYYSVRYDIWKEELINYYNMLNNELKDLQTSLIVGHEFIRGERVPSEAEKAADEIALNEQTTADKVAFEAAARAVAIEAMRAQYVAGLCEAGEDIQPMVDAMLARYEAGEDAETIIAEMRAEYGLDTDTEEEEEITAEETVEVTVAVPEEDDYEFTKYTSDNNQIVRVTYDNGTSFILNYNDFAVTVEGVEEVIPAYGFVKIN